MKIDSARQEKGGGRVESCCGQKHIKEGRPSEVDVVDIRKVPPGCDGIQTIRGNVGMRPELLV